MVFYGCKKIQSEQQEHQYQSIKIQLLKEFGKPITPLNQKSLASILFGAGDVILKTIQMSLNIPQYFRTTQIYEDQQYLKQQIKKKASLQLFCKKVTENKFYLIKNYPIESRLLFLNSTVFILCLLSIRSNREIGHKFQGLIKSCIFGYAFGSVLIVPEIYNSIMINRFF